MKTTTHISKTIISLSALFIFLTTTLYGQNKPTSVNKDDNSHYTNIGNIGLTITNFGTYGNGFALWPNQPSCEYPLGSGIEHIFDGGLWIGAFKSTDANGSNRQGPFVTTGAVDAASVSSRGGGFEWTNGATDGMKERSSLITSKYYDPAAISHQDFICDYNDTSTSFTNGEVIVDHSPLGLKVHQESYAWNFPFADYFVIMNYWIKNVGNGYLDSIYVGTWTDLVVRNTKMTQPRGATFFDKGGNGFSPKYKMGYEFDSKGDVGFTDSYIGIQLLGASTPVDSANYVTWQYKNSTDPIFFAPQTDVERYSKMTGFFASNTRYGFGVNPSTLKNPSNRSTMVTGGPFRKLAPGDSLNVVMAIVCAKKYGTALASEDSEEQKTNLYANAEWALRAYYGEDKNRNNVLDAGEDLDGDGKITRFILPAPPTSPKVKVVTESNKVTVYWDTTAEASVDPISAVKDFEGYRLYRTNAGFDITLNQNTQSSLIYMAEYDKSGDTIGYETGFNSIRMATPKKFDGDPTEYRYKYEVNNLLNGWQYLFSVTAFDRGDVTNRIESLESSSLYNLQRVVPGTTPTSDPGVEVGVYPNPYYAYAYWDGGQERLRKLIFYNLPANCDLTIYTLAGDIVKKIHHDQSSNGSDIKWFQNYASDGKQKMSGGEHAWDLISDNDQAIATGLYLFVVKDLDTGNTKTGKFLIIK